MRCADDDVDNDNDIDDSEDKEVTNKIFLC